MSPRRAATDAALNGADPPLSLMSDGANTMKHSEFHRTHRVGWLRAAVLGANDGIVSTASLIVGVAAAESSRSSVLVAGRRAGRSGGGGAVDGRRRMRFRQFASRQRERRYNRERGELAADGEQEHAELAAIYVSRGLDDRLASAVATQLMTNTQDDDRRSRFKSKNGTLSAIGGNTDCLSENRRSTRLE